MRTTKDRYVIRASLPVSRPGPGRRQQQVAVESYGTHQLADVLMRVETLLSQGHILSINPPAEPPTVDAVACPDPTTATITVLAS